MAKGAALDVEKQFGLPDCRCRGFHGRASLHHPTRRVMENKRGKRDVNHVSLCSHLLATTHTSPGPAAVVSGPGLGPAVVPCTAAFLGQCM